MILIDTSNLFYGIKKAFGQDARIDYEHFLADLRELPNANDTIAYVSEYDSSAVRFADWLKTAGACSKVKLKEPRRMTIGAESALITNWGVEISVDSLLSEDKTIIICSSDVSLIPLLLALKERCAVVYVYAPYIPPAIAECGVMTKKITEEYIFDANDADTE